MAQDFAPGGEVKTFNTYTKEEAQDILDHPIACACLGPSPYFPIQDDGKRLCFCAQRQIDAMASLGEPFAHPEGEVTGNA